MKKRKTHAFGKDVYLLGVDSEGMYYWLEEAVWNCGWYWGLGYVETYTNNKYPERASDINSHQHFDGMFFNCNKNGYDAFKELFVDSPLYNNKDAFGYYKDLYRLIELMKSLYTARQYSDMLHIGGSHYTANPCGELIRDEGEYNRITRVVIPAMLEEVYRLLSVE